jgi:hypothetical protein
VLKFTVVVKVLVDLWCCLLLFCLALFYSKGEGVHIRNFLVNSSGLLPAVDEMLWCITGNQSFVAHVSRYKEHLYSKS